MPSQGEAVETLVHRGPLDLVFSEILRYFFDPTPPYLAGAAAGRFKLGSPH